MLILLLTLVASVASKTTCPRGLISSFYRELGCAPKFEKGPCPTSYDCSTFESRNTEKCFYKGVGYDPDSDLPDEISGTCTASCRCEPHNGTQPSFDCANIECSEDMGMGPPLEPGCHLVYEHGQCCSVEKVCGHPDPSCSPAPVTCSYGNSTYFAGQMFYPDDDQCKECYCKENFQGQLEEPFCYDIKCENLLHAGRSINEGCVPVYYGEKGCCPIDWRCPSPGDVIQKAKTKIRQRTSATCKFGSLTLQPGESLDTGADSVECTCTLPPYLTCIHAHTPMPVVDSQAPC